ncbi:hypothetical protein V2I01_30935 [Micromonospora sp. BRA006-A]|nr:hypothetical protein [Micromonospora sp. BRA006-A]
MGMWDTAGMAASIDEADRARSARAGLTPMSAETGLGCSTPPWWRSSRRWCRP